MTVGGAGGLRRPAPAGVVADATHVLFRDQLEGTAAAIGPFVRG